MEFGTLGGNRYHSVYFSIVQLKYNLFVITGYSIIEKCDGTVRGLSNRNTVEPVLGDDAYLKSM